MPNGVTPNVNKYDTIVAGSGISGLTASLLLAMSGKKVLLLEKAATIGGSLTRFRRDGVPFDTGFHFTGGFDENGLLNRMLKILGIRDRISPVFLKGDRAQEIVFEPDGHRYTLPSGNAALRERFKAYFPEEGRAVDAYFDRLSAVFSRTADLAFIDADRVPMLSGEDLVSLRSVLDELTGNRRLQALLSIFCMCYGVKPSEVSFANHSRVCFSLFESLARVEGGGEAFIEAYRAKLAGFGVEIRCRTAITRCEDVQNRRVTKFRLSSGETVAADSCLLTMHPREILKMLPRECVKPAFVERVEAFENSAGFFSVFGVIDSQEVEEDFGLSITSLLPTEDLDGMLDPKHQGDSALVVVKSREQTATGSRCAITAFEPAYPETVAPWWNSSTGKRPADYARYKRERTDRIRARIERAFPEYRGRLRILDSATMLTFRDWLHSPAGSAYGVKQKLGQLNIIGRLPLANLFAAGQSALLPGIVGAMVSSFVVCRSLIGVEDFSRLVKGAR